MRPLSRNPYVPTLLILCSLALTVAQYLLGAGEWLPLVINWIGAGALATGIWTILTRYTLGQEGHCQAIYISWPVIATSLNLALCTMGGYEVWMDIFTLSCFLIILAIALGTWQQKKSSWSYFLIGVIVGLMTFCQARLLLLALLLLLLLVVFYHMRTWSWRNFWSLITGNVLGLWCLYVASFFLMGEEWADDRILQTFTNIGIQTTLPQLDVWQWMFIALLLVEMLFFAVIGLFRNIGTSIRVHSSIVMLITLTLIQLGFSVITLANYQQHLGILSLYMSIQLSLHNINLRTEANEWWTVSIVVLCMLMVAIPLAIPYIPWNLLF